MPVLLHLDASPSVSTSISRTLSQAYVNAWREKHNPEATVVCRDLALTQISQVNEEWIAAAFTPAEMRSASQRETLSVSDELIAELKDASEYVFGVPMYNFGIPASLKLWIDQVVRLGETYRFDGTQRIGMLSGKRAHILMASGGMYEADTPAANVNFVEPYLRAILGYMGVADVQFYAAGGTAAIAQRKQTRESFLEPHLERIATMTTF